MAWIISCISKCASIYFNAHHVLYQDRINRHLWYMTYFVLWNVKRASLWPDLIQFKFFFFCHYGLSCESQVFSIGAISKRHRHYSLPPTLRLPLCHICHLFSVTFCHLLSNICVQIVQQYYFSSNLTGAIQCLHLPDLTRPNNLYLFMSRVCVLSCNVSFKHVGHKETTWWPLGNHY